MQKGRTPDALKGHPAFVCGWGHVRSSERLQTVVCSRSVGGPVWMTVTSIVCALLIGDMLIRGTLEQAVLVSPWLLLLLWFVYLFLFAPRIVATPDGVAVHNVLRVAQLSWGAIESITARWQIEFRMKEPFGDKPAGVGRPTQRPSRSPRSTRARAR